MTSKKLTKKQQAFCQEYIVDLCATQAAIRAGYSPKTAYSISSELLRKPEVEQRVAELQAERNQRINLSADYVLGRLMAIDQMDVADILLPCGELKPVTEWPLVWRTTLCGLDIITVDSTKDSLTLLKKIKWPDKVKNLELLGRHLGLFNDKLKLQGDPNAPLIAKVVLVPDKALPGVTVRPISEEGDE